MWGSRDLQASPMGMQRSKKDLGAFNELKDCNAIITHMDQQEEKVHEYEDIFKIGNMGSASKVKIKVIQGMIQVERPRNWSIDNIKKITSEIKNIELYNGKKENSIKL